MLISRVPEHNGGAGEGLEVDHVEDDHTHEYRTASELFEIMAKNQNFNSNDVESLTTRDLVLLYKNIESGTKLMNDASETKLIRSNQYVETIVHNDDPESEGSEFEEIYSNEDLHNVVLINKERMDLFNSPPSLENTLCHKLGDLEIQSPDFNSNYDKHFLFKDPYIKEQLKSMNLLANSNEFEGMLLPASLLDYICCKRLEDNYNFYMDNIIRYVQHTIEQLKRISNGDYLTDKAKEKWREVENDKDIVDNNNTKVLATSTSIPLHVEHKSGGLFSTWDDIVHSEMDVRSLSKILEKRIILEVPKLICGSYKLITKCCADNLIISCKKEKKPVEAVNGESLVNVVFQLERSNSGQVMSNISSIIILQNSTTVPSDSLVGTVLPLVYDIPSIKKTAPENNVKIVELPESNDYEIVNSELIKPKLDTISTFSDLVTEDSFIDSLDYPCSDEGNMSLLDHSCQDSSRSNCVFRDAIDNKLIQSEMAFSIVSPDELRVTMQKLNTQSALPEESGDDVSSTVMKKKSPTRVRIKSPYENKSHILEEKKRKKLLEIRERREKKKLALAENCKISKHKFAKSGVMPQPSSSVTKLSITNKSFYNSIYGQNAGIEKQNIGIYRKGAKKDVEEIAAGDTEGDSDGLASSDQNNNKYTNRSYYLDETVTEMMFMEMKQEEKKDTCSVSTSEVSNDFQVNLKMLSQLIGPSMTDLNIADNVTNDSKPEPLMKIVCTEEKNISPSKDLTASQSINNIALFNTPIHINHDKIDPKKSTSTIECRRSIDKIYDLMKKLEKQDRSEIKPLNTKLAAVEIEKYNITGGRGSSTIQGSDSGTSVKHHLTSTNPSCFSFDKNNISEIIAPITQIKETDTPMAVIPKVIISSKSQTPKTHLDKTKEEHKKLVINHSPIVSDNPLQAISQLLHEFESVQKTRQKSAVEPKPKKIDAIVTTDVKNTCRQNSVKRRSRLDQHMKASALQPERSPKITPFQKRPRQLIEVPKNVHPQSPIEDKYADKNTKNKIVDIIDEVKEARGEAVRGPSKINSRLNSLAQPKRSYVQAHSTEYQYKYGKTLMADRLQRLATAPPPTAPDKILPLAHPRNKVKRTGVEAISTASVKPSSSPVPPLDIGTRRRRSTSNSSAEKTNLSPERGSSSKQNVPETPEILKKKMVAVESYVKCHYGSPSSPTAINGPLQETQLSRVPLLPNDLELASLTSSPSPNEEATTIGNKLHRIIDTMTHTTPHGLGVLAECQESNSKIVKNATDDISLTDNLSTCDEHISTDSEFNDDIFEDRKVQTAVENVENVTRKEFTYEEVGEYFQQNLQSNYSTIQLETLENALYRQMSAGTFQNRLRMKKITLTPKQSMQQVLLLQSGDASSIVIKSTASQKLKINNSRRENLPVLSRSRIDWNLVKFPMQVATVGYAFPHYHSLQFSTKSLKLLDTSTSSINKGTMERSLNKNDKISQCFKGEPQTPLQQVTQNESQKQAPNSAITEFFKNNNVTKMFQAPKPEVKEINIGKRSNINDDEQSDKNELTDKISNNQKCHSSVKSEDVDYTTSLDVLMGLLNEIKNITTCQTHMTTAKETYSSNSINPDGFELETILNNAAALEKSVHKSPRDIVSIASLDKLRQLESNPSIYSFYLSDDEDQRCFSTIHLKSDIHQNVINVPYPKPVCVDKEIGVDLMTKEYVNRFTDVPSRFIPLTVNHSTNVTSSLIGVISVPSTQSLYSFTEYHTMYSETSTLNSCKNIIELADIANEDNLQKTIFTGKIKTEILNDHMISEHIEIKDVKKQEENKDSISKQCLLTSNFDPLMNMKRDILVTVYSILVLTVFAALSFPEVLYHLS